MGNELLLSAAGCVAAAAPLALLSFALVPRSLLLRSPKGFARIGAWVSMAALAFAVAAVIARARLGVVDLSFQVFGSFRLGVLLDTLSGMVLVLVAFLLSVVTRYSVNYLAGDPRQGLFTKWLCLTGGSVLALVISGNVLQFAMAWSATSLCLHRLLVYYPDRPGAVLAARKKFIISRIGDACLLGVILLVYHTFHTWEFTEILRAAKQMHAGGAEHVSSSVGAICFLLVAGAMLKSAQFPFHSWLPDTMETPTPVSALMHAGIINAGGFLIMRLSPLVTLSASAMTLLALVGAFTALFASLVMLTHASIKRSLAFSTVAQMGFMMLECGLGAFGLALLHLIAHSLYKAHAFLSSGNMVSMAKSAWVPKAYPSANPPSLAASLAVSICLVLGSAWLLGVDYLHERGVLVLGCTFAMALAYALWTLWSQTPSLKGALCGGLLAGALALVYCLLERTFGSLLGENAWTNTHLNSWPGLALIAVLLGLFLAVLIIQTELPRWSRRPWLQTLYVHARNGFYFNTLANRAVAALYRTNPFGNNSWKP